MEVGEGVGGGPERLGIVLAARDKVFVKVVDELGDRVERGFRFKGLARRADADERGDGGGRIEERAAGADGAETLAARLALKRLEGGLIAGAPDLGAELERIEGRGARGRLGEHREGGGGGERDEGGGEEGGGGAFHHHQRAVSGSLEARGRASVRK